MNQHKTPLFDALKKYAREDPVYYRIPGHRFDRGIAPAFREYTGDALFKLDVTETPPLDDLHNASGAIKEAQELAAEAFGARRTFFLVNGSTCGNQSMILAAAGEGQKILVSRNAHKSVMAGLILSGADPVYLPVTRLDFPGIQGGADPARAAALLDANPGCRGLFTVSPTYHGLCGDLPGLAQVTRERGIPLLVDEAHGSHFYFHPDLPGGALTLGADCAVMSLHKTGGSLTQSSLLHLKGNLLDEVRLDRALRMTQSTSPSYVLMASLDTARQDLAVRGREMLDRALEMAETLRAGVNRIPGVRCPGRELVGLPGVCDADPTRLVINLDGLELDGYTARERLYRNFGVDVEMADQRNIVLIVTFGNTPRDGERFLNALSSLAKEAGPRRGKRPGAVELPGIPPRELTPRQAWFAPGTAVPWKEARGRIAGEMAAPYPPGIPVVYPGEVITPEIWDFLEECRREGRHLHGPADTCLNTFQVIAL